MNEQACTCGADRTGPSAEAHDDDCPAKWLDRTLGEAHPAPRSNKQVLSWPWDEIKELVGRLKGYTEITKRVWRSGFDAEDREWLGGDFEAALREHGDIVTMWLAVERHCRAECDRGHPDMPTDTKHRESVEFCLAIARCGRRAGLMRKEDLEWIEKRIMAEVDALKPV